MSERSLFSVTSAYVTIFQFKENRKDFQLLWARDLHVVL
jgi:hypothetical protein